MDRSEGFRRRTTTDDAVMRAISEPLTLAIAAMQLFMATCAQRNQFGTFVGALLTARLLVMDCQVLPGAADLASPVVPLHDLPAKLLVRAGL